MQISTSKAVVAIFSAGWVLPIAVGVNAYLQFMQDDFPLSIQGKVPENSFPFLDLSRSCFKIGLAWLFLAVLFWSYRLFKPEAAGA